jgi:hypothetical protein
LAKEIPAMKRWTLVLGIVAIVAGAPAFADDAIMTVGPADPTMCPDSQGVEEAERLYQGTGAYVPPPGSGTPQIEMLETVVMCTPTAFCPTTFPVSTQCPITPSICISCETLFQMTECQQLPTICPATPTECVLDPTLCQEVPTVCVATECPANPTICPSVDTSCPEMATWCPPSNTSCPEVVTSCPGEPTQCGTWQGVTLCLDGSGGTWTVCPAKATYCPLAPPECDPSRADVTLDGKTNILDIKGVRNDLRRDPGESGVFGDVNEDGKVNVLDLIYVRNRLGE